MSNFDWSPVEQEWKRLIVAAIRDLVSAFPDERFYVGAFWLLYGDYSSLLPPAFGFNSEAHAILQSDSSGDADVRWHPPDWRWSVIDSVSAVITPLYAPLRSLDLSDEAYESLWEEHLQMLSRVCRDLTESAASGTAAFEGLHLPDGFFLGIIDGAQGDDYERLLRLSIDDTHLARHPNLVSP